MSGRFEHSVTVAEEPKNYPMYRFEASCNCGWNAKAPSVDEAKEAADRHVRANAGGVVKINVTPSNNPAKGNEVKPALTHPSVPGTNKFAPSVNDATKEANLAGGAVDAGKTKEIKDAKKTAEAVDAKKEEQPKGEGLKKSFA